MLFLYPNKFDIMSETKVPKDVDEYKKHYSDNGFWNKVKALGKKVLKPALLLYYVMKSPDTPLGIKASIVGALGYLILPTDLIPDIVPLTGYTDDLGALLSVVKMCEAYITPEIKEQADAKLNEL